jgi:hypothetical protein
MTNRIVQVLGSGYGSTPASVVATWNGIQVFSGTVYTQDSPVPVAPTPGPAPGQVLFTFEIPMDVDGNISMTTDVIGNPVLFTEILANYANLEANSTSYTSSGASRFITIAGNLDVLDVRSQVILNGISLPITDPKPSTETGTWWWVVGTDTSMSCQVAVQAGLE